MKRRDPIMTDTSDASGSPASFRIAVSALIFDRERVLLALRRDIDWWNLPGGGMEVGETVDEALLREVAEETGLEVEIEQLVGVYSKPQKQEIVLAFRCQITGGTLRATEETSECRYFLRDELPDNSLHRPRKRDEYSLLDQHSTRIVDRRNT